MLTTARLFAAATLLVASLASHSHAGPTEEEARAFLAGLRPELRERAQVAFGDENRLDWHFTPRARRGVSLGEMNEAERLLAHGLLRAGLSSQGYLKSLATMELDVALREAAEARGQRADFRDPLLYYVTVFGEPGGEGPWGWRFEGHHVSLNFSSVTGGVAVTPAFFGANPAEVREGRRAGWRVLGVEEDLARELLASLDGPQREAGVVRSEAPRDILMGPGLGVEALGPERGVAYAELREGQRALVEALIETWAGNLAPELRDGQLARIRGAGLGGVRFLWIGSEEPGRGHYYRLRGPTFVIEYDNTQNGANHVHTVWRDPERDFGEDLLRAHLGAHLGAERAGAERTARE